MRCPSARQLAAASLGADPKALLHAEDCARCRGELAAMAEVGAFARRAPVRVASAERRARIAALVMATSDAAGPPRKSRVPLVALAITGLAAALTLIAWGFSPGPREQPSERPSERIVALPPLPTPSVQPALGPEVRAVAPKERVQPVESAGSGAGPVAHREAPASDVPPVAREPSPPRRAPRAAAPPENRVFAGSEEQHADALARDQISLAPEPVEPISPLTAFQTGWTALRQARYADAIAAFDRATDRAVAEDAAYWAAIASARAGDHADAARRLRAFLASFPGTARRSEASKLLVRLAP